MFLSALLAGLLGGWAGKGTFGGIRMLRFGAWWLLVLGLALQIGVSAIAHGHELDAWDTTGVLLSLLAVGAWIGVAFRRNGRGIQAGLCVLGLGWLLNALVMVVNGAMPVSAWALRHSSGLGPDSVKSLTVSKHVLADSGTPLRFLGDVIPVAPVQAPVSPGDVVLLVGIALVIAAAMREAPRSTSTRTV